MRRQDELQILYAGQDAPGRKFLLRQMGGLAHSFDSGELLEFLRGELGCAEPHLRVQDAGGAGRRAAVPPLRGRPAAAVPAVRPVAAAELTVGLRPPRPPCLDLTGDVLRFDSQIGLVPRACMLLLSPRRNEERDPRSRGGIR
jgi:hypothetical protein